MEETIWQPSTEQQWMWQLACDLLETYDYLQECTGDEKEKASRYWNEALEVAEGAIESQSLSIEYSSYLLTLIWELQNDMPSDISNYNS
jgi:hypothetical protein